MISKDKRVPRLKRKKRIRKNIFGTASRPRLTIYRSCKHLYVQIVEDEKGVTLTAASTLSKELAQLQSTKNKDAAKAVGNLIAQQALAKGIDKVVFDRNGYLYHGKIKALADAARESGLKF